MDDDDDFLMEDSDYEFEADDGEDADADDADFDDDESDDIQVRLENGYYNAKGKKDENLDEAVLSFRRVIELDRSETGKASTEWGFKATKQLIKCSFQLQQLDQILSTFDTIWDYQALLSKNYLEKSIGNLLDYLSNTANVEFLQAIYAKALVALEKLKNERLWTKTQLKLAKLYLDRRQYVALQQVLDTLRAHLETGEGTSDDVQRKGTHLLEVYAIEIQMHADTQNVKRLKELVAMCLAVKSAIPHPRIMGVIMECAGKMHMLERDWDAAQQSFFQAFKNYDEAGSMQRVQCLKYLVLANMLTESSINPFDSQETKPYKNDEQLKAMTDLVSAYQRHSIHEFQKILRDNKTTILDDPFIAHHISQVTESIQTQVLLQYIPAYSSVSLDHLRQLLGSTVTVRDVEKIVTKSIADDKLDARVCQISGMVHMRRADIDEEAQTRALSRWVQELNRLVI